MNLRSIKKFPLYLDQTIGDEIDSSIDLGDDEKNYLFECLYRAEQRYDQLEAYRYVEENWLARDIKTFNAADFINLAKEIHKVACHTLAIIKNQNQAGEYSNYPLHVLQETGVDDVSFEDFFHPECSLINYEILKKYKSEEIANQYIWFVNFITLELEYSDKDSMQSVKDSADLQRNYINHPAAKAYNSVHKLIHPEAIELEMQDFANNLITKIAANNDSVHCAAYALYKLVTIHPFVGGNRRTARIFINTLFMLFGQSPIVIPPSKVKEYYLAIERSSDQDIQPIENLLRQFANIAVDKANLSLSEKLCSPVTYYFSIPNAGTKLFKMVRHKNHYSIQGVIKNDWRDEAKQLIKTYPNAAKFYLDLTNRLHGVANDNNNEVVPASELIPEISAEPATYKQIYHLVANETARISGTKIHDVGLLYSFDDPSEIVVVFKDQQNNISMTCCDIHTSLGFLKEEAGFMQGKYTIDVLRHGAEKSPIEKPLYEAIEKILGKIPNSNNKFAKSQVCSTPYLLIIDGKYVLPVKSTLAEIVYLNILKKPPSEKNKYKNFRLNENHKLTAIRKYERLLMYTLHCKETQLPTLVVNDEWTGNYPQLSPVARHFIDETRNITNKEVLANILLATIKRIGQTQLNPEVLPQTIQELQNFYKITQNNLYYNLSRITFFKPTDKEKDVVKEMPDRVINTIASYTETLALNTFRTFN